MCKFAQDVGVLLEHSQHPPEAEIKKPGLLTRKNTYDKWRHAKRLIQKYCCNDKPQKGLRLARP